MKNSLFQWRQLSAVLAGGALLSIGAPASALTILDLTTVGSSGTANGAIYRWTDFDSSGTGNIDPFLRIQQNGGEAGYNNDVGGTPYNTKADGWTSDLQMSGLITINIGGTNYYEFLLDINENSGGSHELLSLNNIMIFTRTQALTSTPAPVNPTAASLITAWNGTGPGVTTTRFQMDVGAQGDTTVELDYDLNAGSGKGDMFLYVPASLFAGAASTDFVYFYSLFGTPNDADAGFEEWSIRSCYPNCPVPEPGTLALFALGLVGVRLARRKLAA